MVKDHSNNERVNLLLPHGLLFLINIKGSFICTISQTGLHIPQPFLHQFWSTGWNEIEKVEVGLHLGHRDFKNLLSGLELVPRCDPSTYQLTGQQTSVLVSPVNGPIGLFIIEINAPQMVSPISGPIGLFITKFNTPELV